MLCTPPVHLRRASFGFTLIEVMIAVVIVAVLVAVALPAYRDSVRKGRRAEAFAALATVQQTQERYRGNHASYGARTDLLPIINANTPNDLYAISVTDVNETGYTATATAQGAQAAETGCRILSVRVAGGNISYGAGESVAAFPDVNRCWAK